MALIECCGRIINGSYSGNHQKCFNPTCPYNAQAGCIFIECINNGVENCLDWVSEVPIKRPVINAILSLGKLENLEW